MAFDILDQHPAELPAFHAAGQTATRAELKLAGQRAAAFLNELGLRRGDTVAVWIPDGAIWLQLLFGAAQLGVLMVPVSTRLKLSEAQHIVGTAAARVLVVPEKFLDFDYAGAGRTMQASLAALAHVIEVPAEGGFQWLACEPHREISGRDADALCTFSTSGTTGKPKLAVHTQGGLAAHARNAGQVTEIRPGDTMLCALPLYGVLGFVSAVAALAAGGTCVFLPVFKADAAAAAIERHGVTHFYASDGMFDMVFGAQGSFATWRRGGFAEFAGLGAKVIDQAWSRWGLRLSGIYGMSECLALMAIRDTAGDARERGMAGGTPISPEMRFRIVDPGTGLPKEDGEQGELQLRGYNVMKGYLNNAASTADAFTSDGWLKTGDLAYAKGNEFFYLARLKDSLRLKGYLVDPTEVEDFLCSHPGVEAAQVVGVHQDGEGDVAVAFVRPSAQPAAESELLAYCKGGIAGFKVPRRIVPIDEFPQSNGPNGVKILKNVLREMAKPYLESSPSSTAQ
ncbi:Long-chain-fatty-acid--CoA ligase [Variovorax sp. PBS-H4]|uniref:AMP-binding protein n=1 Tax=Variovorax sp. PBS-H4 TaxID=434008 RepID=UPI001318DC35|nr:AMP-binding protein [Variovorax sp. PBS-H4]VTU37876.1 Long-chain-fatty-acid--CoA ligase [Variovorax sp. PBS-H4]